MTKQYDAALETGEGGTIEEFNENIEKYFQGINPVILPIDDEIRLILSHAFLGSDHDISRETFDLAISEISKYFGVIAPDFLEWARWHYYRINNNLGYWQSVQEPSVIRTSKQVWEEFKKEMDGQK